MPDENLVAGDAAQQTQNSPAGNSSQNDENLAGNKMDANTPGASSQPEDAKTDSQKPKAASDIVADVLKATGDSSPQGSSDGQKPDAAKTGDKANDPQGQDAKTGDDDEGIPQEFHNHPRWKKLQTQRDEARKELTELKRQVGAVSQDAEDFRTLSTFMDTHDIAAEEVAETLQWLALRNSDPVAFYKKFSDLKAEMDLQFGAVLPQDLQDRVNAGEITEDDAKRIVQAEAQTKMSQAQSQRITERQQNQNRQSQLAQLRTIMKNTVNDWEKQQMAKDPDYKAKQPFVVDAIRSLAMQYGPPRNAQEALKYAEIAYSEVTKRMTSALPQKKPVSPSPQGSKQVQIVAQPKNATDIVTNILAAGA